MSTGSEKAIVALRGGSEFWGPRVAISLVGARAMQARFHGVCRLLESLQTQKPREKANEVAALLTRCGFYSCIQRVSKTCKQNIFGVACKFYLPLGF